MKALFVLVLLSHAVLLAEEQKVLLPPVLKASVTSAFGYREDPISHNKGFHPGADFGAKAGTLVRAVATGQVIFASRFRGYGILVVIRHGTVLSSHYAHLRRALVSAGDYVRRGEIIGLVGATGRVTGAHLHFELRLGGRPSDPLRFIG